VSEGVTKTEAIGCFLMPPEYKTDRTHAFAQHGGHPTALMRAEYCFTSKDIEDIALKFIAVRAAIGRLRQEVTKNNEGEMPLILKFKQEAETKAGNKKSGS
jgi:hypothetical protein